MARYVIEAMQEGDWPQVREIYAQGIATGDATFEQEPPSWEQWTAGHLPGCRLVARGKDGAALGWAALGPVSNRRVYAGVAEVSIYVGAGSRGQGIGSALVAALIASSEQASIWTLQAGIFPENAASIAMHQKAGFRVVGRRERIAQMDGRWRDVLLLERRSQVV